MSDQIDASECIRWKWSHYYRISLSKVIRAEFRSNSEKPLNTSPVMGLTKGSIFWFSQSKKNYLEDPKEISFFSS